MLKKLGVNIDHVATLRQARGEIYPDPVWAAIICELAGADSIVLHLRQDRRHINERDLRLLRELVKSRLNLEMSTSQEIVEIALDTKPDQITLVPERRQELTTEGGLDVQGNKKLIEGIVKKFKEADIRVSLFVDPVPEQVESCLQVGAQFVELHTGRYACARDETQRQKEFTSLLETARFARSLGLGVNAGHGLNYWNVKGICRIKEIEELNIGHAIISRAVLVGLERAVKEMLELIQWTSPQV
jgi:pyridoxine 5-phosphate synthase